MVLIRFALIGVIVYLLARSFMKIGEEGVSSPGNTEPKKDSNISNKGVSKSIGEYVEYEEVDK